MVARLRFLGAVAGLAGLAACGHSPLPRDAALQRDLDLARGQGLELAPQRNTRATLSADELIPAGNQRRATIARPASQRRERPSTVSRSPATPPHATVAETPTPSAPARDSVIEPVPATQRPSTAGAISPPPPGGYKSMGEIIRKAPFPINP